jgi:hypothetical protein
LRGEPLALNAPSAIWSILRQPAGADFSTTTYRGPLAASTFKSQFPAASDVQVAATGRPENDCVWLVPFA